MAAYVIEAKSADERVTPARLPIKGVLNGDLHVTLDVAKPSELEQVRGTQLHKQAQSERG